jgi:SulP family sulfate permease
MMTWPIACGANGWAHPRGSALRDSGRPGAHPRGDRFSIIAGVDPKVGLYASVCIAIVSAIVGGRPGLISAATGAMAVVMVSLVRDHGLQYLFAATLLTGALQIVAGWLRLGPGHALYPALGDDRLRQRPGAVDLLGALPQFAGASWQMYAMVAAGLAIIYLFPRLTKAVPAPLVAILTLSALAIAVGSDVRTVGDMGRCRPRCPPSPCRRCRSPWRPSGSSPPTPSPWRWWG